MSDDTDTGVTAEAAAPDAEPAGGQSIEAMLGEAWDADQKAQEGQDSGSEAPSDTPPQGADSPPTKTAPEGGTPPSGGGEDKGKEEPLSAPEHWDAAAKETFGKQPREVQQWMLDRHKSLEGDHTRKTQEIAPLREAAGRWQRYVERTGTRDVTGAVDALLQTDATLRFGSEAERHALITRLAEGHGLKVVRPGQEGGGEGGGEEDALGAEIKRHLTPALDPIVQRLEQLGSGWQEEQETRARSEYTRMLNEIDAFQAAKDEAGNPKYPHYAEVEAEMTQLAQAERSSGRTPKLVELYERAVWMVPTVREKLIAAQAQTAQQAARERAEKARKASSSVADGGSGAAAQGKQPRSLEDELSAVYDEVAAAG